MSELQSLLNYLIKNKNTKVKSAALIVSRYSNDLKALKMANIILDDEIIIDILEMESLVNPDKFDFPKPDLGRIGLENEEIL